MRLNSSPPANPPLILNSPISTETQSAFPDFRGKKPVVLAFLRGFM